MGNSSDDLRVKEQTLFYIKDCVTKFSKLRPNRDRTKDVFSPCLTDISKCFSFPGLIHLCAEHDPKILRSVLKIALEKCAKAEKQMNEKKESKRREESEKREAETQLGPENHKQAKVQRLVKAHAALTALTHQSEEEMENVSDTYQEDSDLQHTSPNVDSHDCISTAENASMSPHNSSNGNGLFVPGSGVESGQSMETTLGPSRMDGPLRSSATASPSSPEIMLTNNATKSQTPTTYEVEKGLVRGVEKIRKYVMRVCLCFSEGYHANKSYNPAKELRNLFPIFQKFPFEIVKDKLLVELGSRIMVPGQKTAIASTVDLFNPSDILDALQCIKMTTINAKVNRVYGQMRLFKSVQSKIDGGYVPDNALTHGVAAHTSILTKMAGRSAGNVSEKERSERKRSFDYEYDAGKKWVDVTKWFGGEGIVLIFVTAG